MKPAILVAASLALTVSACASTDSLHKVSDPHTMTQLSTYEWTLDKATDTNDSRIDKLFAEKGGPLTLRFRDDRVHVANTCNVMSGDASVDDDGQLVIGHFLSTMMACQDDGRQIPDQAVKSRLRKPLDFTLKTGDDARLTLVTSADDTLVFTGEPREDKHDLD